MSFSDRRYDDRGFDYLQDRPTGTLWLLAFVTGCSLVAWGVGGGVEGAGFTNITHWMGVRGVELRRFEIWRLLSYQFLHGGVGHLFWNMLTFFLFASIIEGMTGARRLVQMYLGFGAFAGLIVLFQGRAPVGMTIGASGANMGLITYLAGAHPRLTVYIFGFPIRMWVIAAFWVAIDLMSIVAQSSFDMVAHGVHLTGAAAGIGYALVWPRIADGVRARKLRTERVRRDRQIQREIDEDAELDRILEKINQVGMAQLNERERQFLRTQSEKKKAKTRT